MAAKDRIIDEALRLRRGQMALTPAQEAEARRFATERIEAQLSMEPVDEREAERWLRQAYQAAKLEPPKTIIWLDGPLQLLHLPAVVSKVQRQVEAEVRRHVESQVGFPVEAQVWNQLLTVLAQVEGQVQDQVQEQVEHQVGFQVGSQVWTQVEHQVGSQAWTQVGPQAWTQVGRQVDTPVWTQVGHQVERQVMAHVLYEVWTQVGRQVMAQVWNEVLPVIQAQVKAKVLPRARRQAEARLRSLVEGLVWRQAEELVSESLRAYHDAAGLAYYRFFDAYLAPNAYHALAHFNELVSGYRLEQEVAVSMRRPKVLARDAQGQLHNASGKAIEYLDGWGFSAWHGVTVPEQVILQPETLTREDFLRERNVEVRRVMMERMGRRVISELGGRLIDAGPRGHLYEVDLPDDPERVAHYVWVQDASTPRQYFLRVPPQIRTAAEAVAWTFSLTIEAYQPLRET